MNAPNGATDAHYDTWKAEHQDDDAAHQEMMDTARALNAEAALDGMTVNQLRSRALAISKQITELVSFFFSSGIVHADVLH